MYVSVHQQLGQSENFTTQVESITKTGLLSFLGCEGLDRLKVKVVVKMEVVKILSVNQQVEHVVTLATNLNTSLDPVKLCRLEELGRFEGSEEVLLVESLGRSVLESVEDIALEKLLVTHTDLDWMSRWAVLLVP